MFSDAEHHFMCLVTIISSLKKVFCPFLNWVVFLWMLNCVSCLHMLAINPSWIIPSANIPSPSVVCLFVVSVVPLSSCNSCWGTASPDVHLFMHYMHPCPCRTKEEEPSADTTAITDASEYSVQLFQRTHYFWVSQH